MSIQVTPGSGVSVATDLAAGDNYQIVKLNWGDLGATQPATLSNPFPMQAPNGILTLHTDATPATQTITAADVASSTGSGANSQTIITGTPTANSTATFTVSNYDTATVQVTGTWVGTLQSEISLDGGVTWYLRTVHQAGTTSYTTSFTANFAGGVVVGGYTTYRIRCTAYTSGTATVKLITSLNPNLVHISSGLPPGTNSIGAITNTTFAATQSGTWNIGTITTLPSLPAGANAIGSITNTTFASTQSGTWTVRTQDGAGTALTSTSGVLDVNTKPTISFTTPSATGATVTTTSSTVLASNASRKYASIINYGAVDCFLNLTSAATLTTGIYLKAGGGQYEITTGTLHGLAVTGIVASGTTTLCILEGT